MADFAADLAEMHCRTGYTKMVVDQRDIVPKFDHLTGEQIYNLAKQMDQYSDVLSKARIAIICSATIQLGMQQMWNVLVDARGIKLTHKAFLDADQAFAWLREGDE